MILGFKITELQKTMMERLEVKDQQRVFEELPGTLTLDITMARRQDDKK